LIAVTRLGSTIRLAAFSGGPPTPWIPRGAVRPPVPAGAIGPRRFRPARNALAPAGAGGQARPMRLLVLGGTRFLGRGVVAAALAAGDRVTIFDLLAAWHAR
jgi:hypothetical protein